MNTLHLEDIKKQLSYCPESGILKYIANDKVVDNRNSCGYVRVCVNKKRYLAHRIAWFMHYGEAPDSKKEIDHIDNDKANNKISNLRLVTSRENKMNKRLQSNNSTGINGVSLDKRTGMYEVSIKTQGKKIFIGYYENLDNAIIARKAVDRVLCFNEKHGLKID